MSREEGRRQTPKLESSSSVSVAIPGGRVFVKSFVICIGLLNSCRPSYAFFASSSATSAYGLPFPLCENRRAFVSFTNFTFTVWTPQAQWALQLLRDPRRAPSPSPSPKLPITDVFPIFRSVICLCGSAFLYAAGGSVSDPFPNNSVTKCFLFLHSSSILRP
ncbi:hypothetical protein FIBSPDRAFT_962363 [Athelia psychrophila]|uniref:Uncharacterized protein n=1 Tax=Athelia psychrophila TaxID=1759441 RepID=A0A166A9D8_9AGAM|nr:hypothetical protein FIBSPDRAFT_962363 [Fibularhizoctonia sp. CBS 109695]